MKCFIPLLYIVYYGNVLFFSHVHIEPTGIYIHSHPSKKTASHEGTHTHKSLLEIQFIGELSSFQTDGKGVGVLIYQSFISPVITILQNICFLQETGSFYNCNLLRAPPSIHYFI